jgi:hypothetical protein
MTRRRDDAERSDEEERCARPGADDDAERSDVGAPPSRAAARGRGAVRMTRRRRRCRAQRCGGTAQPRSGEGERSGAHD